METCKKCGAQVEQFEQQRGELFCPVCGWSVEAVKAENGTSGNSEARAHEKTVAIWSKVFGVLILVFGLIGSISLIGLVDILSGVRIMQRDERGRSAFMLIFRIQVVVTLVTIAALAVFFLIDYNAAIVGSIGFFTIGTGLPALLKIPAVLYFRRQSVKAQFSKGVSVI